MIKFKVTMKGIDQAIDFEGGDWPASMADAMTAAGTETMDIYRDVLGTYPAEHPQQKYVRTYNLRDGWMSAPVVTFFPANPFMGVVQITNPVEYTTSVQGDDSGAGQETIQIGWWKTAYEISQDTSLQERAVPIYESKIQQAIDKVEKRRP